MEITGDSVYSKMKWEAGVHRVQRVPATESQGRVHTSTATVAVMPECDEVDVNIDAKDIEMSTMRSGGAGGQVRTSSRGLENMPKKNLFSPKEFLFGTGASFFPGVVSCSTAFSIG